MDSLPVLRTNITTPAGQFDLALPVETLVALFADFYEKMESPACSFWYTPSDRVLEAGAGLGYVTTAIAKRAGHVVAVEGLPEFAEIVAANLQLNGCENSLVLNGALGTTTDDVKFYRRALAYASSPIPGHDPVTSEVIVPGLAIDTLVKEHNLNCLHLDMEGAEKDVFLSTDYASINKVLMEVHAYIYGTKGVVEIFRKLLNEGFESVFMADPFGVSFSTNQTVVVGFARPEQKKEILTRFKAIHNMYYYLDVAKDGEGVSVQTFEEA